MHTTKNLTPSQLADIRESFKLFDKNGDGFISAEELEEAMKTLGQNPSAEELQDIMRQVDRDGNGSIDFDEFVHMMSERVISEEAMRQHRREKQLRRAFAVFDKDNNGLIDLADLRSVMESQGQVLSDEELSDMIKEADKNGDGFVDFSEASSSSLAKLRGAVDRVMSDTRDEQEKRQPNIWSEVASGLKKNVPGADQSGGGRLIKKSLYQHLDSKFNKPTPSEQGGSLRVEDFLQLPHLQRVKALFENYRPPSEADSKARGGKKSKKTKRRQGYLNLGEFTATLNRVIGHDRFSGQLERLYYKLDTDNSGSVTWTEFCNYMMLYLHERDRLTNRVDPPFKAEPRLRHVLHNKQEPTARLLLTGSPTRPISVSKTGCIMLWDCLLKLESHLETQNPPVDLATAGSSAGKRLFSEWVIDAVFMDNCHKLVLSTTGRELKFYDIASNVIKEEYILYGMKSVPTVLKFFFRKEAANTDSHLFAGDDGGNLTEFVFKKPMQQLFDIPPDPNHRSQRIWYYELASHTKCVDAFHHEGLHTEPINELAYLPDNNCTVTCSAAPNNSVVIYELKHRRTLYTFKLRRGAECFDINWTLNLLVTGSHDHLVRFWNPYVTAKHTALLEGHNNAVLSVKIHEKQGCVLSYARDGIIKAWDLKAHVCVQTVTVRIPYSVTDKLPDHMGSPLTLHLGSNTVYLCSSDNILQYRLGKAADPVPGLILTHKAQLCAALYNPTFKQVTTASDDSSMTTWELDTGNKCLAFADAHNKEEVTCLAYDATYRRLFTGSRHGSMKVWNFQTGQVLHELEKTADAEITGMVAAPMQQRILTVGWSREVVCYRDSNPDDTKRVPLEWKGGVWHEDDILSCDFCPPDLLATASYDGAVLVWNADHEKLLLKLREGYHETIEKKMCRAQGLTPPSTRGASDLRSRSRSRSRSRPNSRHRSAYQPPARTPAPVDKLIFLKKRAADRRYRESGFLLTSEAGHIRFWSVHGRRHEMAVFCAAEGGPEAGECVLAMVSNKRDSALVTGDTAGFVRTWSIANYALFQREQLETNSPHCLQEFRAHNAAIVSVDFAEIEVGEFVVTASVDCTAKLFTISGEAVGTFGQPKPWDIGVRKTWMQAQIDRQKFFEDVVTLGEQEAEEDDERTLADSKNEGVDASASGDEQDNSTDAENCSLKIRSQTMPAIGDTGVYKPLIGAKAEKDFERIRLTRTDRRVEYGGASTHRAVAPGSVCTPYTVLKTTEFKSFNLSDNLPQPSWRAHRSNTVVAAVGSDGQKKQPGRHRPADAESGSETDESTDEEPDRTETQRQVRFPPIVESLRH
uniref:Calmodulin n=1 Tax=Macrostomum lignano TaxID=282301 RepID=A0A1I8GGL5_9PLAT